MVGQLPGRIAQYRNASLEDLWRVKQTLAAGWWCLRTKNANTTRLIALGPVDRGQAGEGRITVAESLLPGARPNDKGVNSWKAVNKRPWHGLAWEIPGAEPPCSVPPYEGG